MDRWFRQGLFEAGKIVCRVTSATCNSFWLRYSLSYMMLSLLFIRCTFLKMACNSKTAVSERDTNVGLRNSSSAYMYMGYL